MVNSKVKGDRFERSVCRALSTCATGVDYATAPLSSLPLRRRSTSIMPIEGHWEGEGDILHRPGVLWPFVVEAKDRQEWGTLDGVFTRKKWPLWGYWDQAAGQADRFSRRAGRAHAPMLIVKRVRFPAIVVMGVVPVGRLWLHRYAATCQTVMVARGERGIVMAPLSGVVRAGVGFVRDAVESLGWAVERAGVGGAVGVTL